MKTNIKLRVTPKQSEAVQKICFANGITWKLIATDKVGYTDLEYLFIETDRIWGRNVYDHNLGPETKGYIEVDADLFIRTNGTCEEFITQQELDDMLNSKSKEDMFKQYGFEVPNFDCTILARVNNDYIGYATIASSTIAALSWALNGTAYRGVTHTPQYNLTPIKKPWHETCKFPALVWDEDNDLLALRTRGEYTASYLDICKLLTNDEIDQLKQDF